MYKLRDNQPNEANPIHVQEYTKMNFTADCPYYGCYLEEFRMFYGTFRVPVGLLVSVFGTVTNTLNIIVLCQKRLKQSPTNIMLTFLSIAQLLLLTGFLTLMLLNYLMSKCVHFTWTLDGAILKLVLVNLNNVCHTTAFASTLYIAFLRVIAVRCPLSAHSIMTAKAARMATLWITLMVVILCIPGYLSSVPAPAYYHPNCTEHWSAYPKSDHFYYDLAYSSNANIVKVSFLLFSVVLKLIPCAIIIILITLLISSLKRVERRRNLLKNPLCNNQKSIETKTIGKYNGLRIVRSSPPAPPQSQSIKNPRSRTTKMLITVVLVCVSVELPHGLLHLISAIEGDSFAENVYDNLGDVIEMLTLLYSSINFIIYCSMSSDFLETFRALFCGCKSERLSKPVLEMTNYKMSERDIRNIVSTTNSRNGSTTNTRSPVQVKRNYSLEQQHLSATGRRQLKHTSYESLLSCSVNTYAV